MRRTYRSKKATTSVIERKELLQNLDGKSTAYDAYSIQNIKRTKRELSCVNTSNTFGVVSNKVRKKKYVKRIVKEARTPCEGSISQSTYLTPDKSIHVNKPLDPFDLLLMSSPTHTVLHLQQSVESPISNKNLFDQCVPKKRGKTYTRKKPRKLQRNICSNNESTDSDKENSDDRRNATTNTSDIQTHKLLVEKEYNVTPKIINDSINNIVNNLSLINKLKDKCSISDSTNKSLRINKHRLTTNLQSPLLLKSPLCSTPFKTKYRGESIFKFSPIMAINEDNNKNSRNIALLKEAINEDNNKNSSNIALVKDHSNSSVTNQDNNQVDQFITIEDNPPASSNLVLVNDITNKITNNQSPIAKEQDKIATLSDVDNSFKFKEISNNLGSGTTSSIDLYSLQSTEIEPFLGFSQRIDMIAPSRNLGVKMSYFENSIKDNVSTAIESNSNPIIESVFNDIDQHVEEIYKNTNIEIESNTSEKDQIAQQNVDNNNTISRSNTTIDIIEKDQSVNDNHQNSDTISELNNTGFEVSKNNVSWLEKDTNNIAISVYNITKNNQSTASNSSNDVNAEEDWDNLSIQSGSSDNDSSYDTCTSEQSLIENNVVIKEPVVVVQRMNDSSFFKYYQNMLCSGDSQNDESDSLDNSSEKFVSKCGSLQDSISSDEISDNLMYPGENKNDGCEHNTSDNKNCIACTDVDYISSNEEEEYMSFVTTRRRTNNSTRNSVITIFNDSYCSSSTDCDKTVLSNNNECKVPEFTPNIKDYNDTIVNLDILSEQGEKTNDNNILDLKNSVNEAEIHEDSRISFVTTRNSNITDRKNSIRLNKYSIKPKTNRELMKISELPDNIKQESELSLSSCLDTKPSIVLRPGKKWERSLSIYKRMTMMADNFNQTILDEEVTETKGRKYRQSVISTIEMQDLNGSLHNESINSRRSTFVSKPSRSTIKIVKDLNSSRLSLCNTTLSDDLQGFLNEECDDTIIELSKLSIADQSHEVTVLDNFHDTSNRIITARDYVLRRCNQTDPILFDECYPDAALKNCHKIGEGVYGEVFLWRARDGRARVLKIVPIAGSIKVNGESQKDFHEIISEIVIAMELSALRAPIAEIERHLDEGKDIEALDLHTIENATDVFNEVLAVRCVYGSYTSRLLDLWDLYDECKGSENDNPAILPVDQQYIVLELANAGQDLESYQFNNAEQAHALFLQVAYGLAVAEEAFQFEHRDLHWGNVLISPTEQKYATFVIRGRAVRVARCGVRGTVIDYSLSRVALRLPGGDAAALYNDLAGDDSLFDAVGDYQFQVYRLMREKLRNDWKNFEPYTNILWLHYTVDKMITSLRYKRTNTKIHKHYIDKLKGIKGRILEYGSAVQYVLTDNEI